MNLLDDASLWGLYARIDNVVDLPDPWPVAANMIEHIPGTRTGLEDT